MRIAIDLQPNPPDVPRSLPAAGANAVTFFYFAMALLAVYGIVATTQHVRIAAAGARCDRELAEAQRDLASAIAEASELSRRTAVATELSDWLAITPPAQALLLALVQEVEPNVSFSRVQVEMEPGQPIARVAVDINTASGDAASRQVANVQNALERVGCRGINVDRDEPTPEGRRFVTTVALPLHGDFTLLTHPGGTP